MKEEEFIQAVEKINRDRIQCQWNREYIEYNRRKRLKKEILGLEFSKVLHHIKVRMFTKKIPRKMANENLPHEIEKKLCRAGDKEKKIVVYTCILGVYDSAKEPYLKPDNCDFVLFTDDHDSNGWKSVQIDDGQYQKNPVLTNRFIKYNAFELFEGEYDYAIYVDGNVCPVSDLSVLTELVNPKYGLAFHNHCSRDCVYDEYVACLNNKKTNPQKMKEIIRKYRKEGMPQHYGLLEGNVIVIDLHNTKAKELFEECWTELSKSGISRDQIIWPYVLWKNGIKICEVCTLGNNVWKNVKLVITEHKGNNV